MRRIQNLYSTDEDREETKEIIRILRDEYNQYESEEDSRNREKILAKLNEIVIDWIKEVGEKVGKTKEFIEQSSGKIFTFGSYRFGVHSKSTDIDALCVAPRHVDRENHFFGMLAGKL